MAPSTGFVFVFALLGLLFYANALAPPRTITKATSSLPHSQPLSGATHYPPIPSLTNVSGSVIASTLSSRPISHRYATSNNDHRKFRFLPRSLTARFSSRAKLMHAAPTSVRDPVETLKPISPTSGEEAAVQSIREAARGSSSDHSQIRRQRTERSSTLAETPETVALEEAAQDVGINQPIPSLKFGGPFVGDIDGDGYYDLVLSFHNGIRTRIYFGESDGTFTLSPFIPKHRDVHGVTAALRTAHSPDRVLAISVGGGKGMNLKFPEIYSVNRNRVVTDISKGYGLGQLATRGRTTAFMDLHMQKKWEKRRNMGGPDMVVSNFLGRSGTLRQFAYENFNGEYKLRDIPGFENQSRGRVDVTDIDNDRIMELISIRSLQIFKLVEPFTFEDVSKDVLPPGFKVPPLSVNAVVEFDMDNDGDFDLYVARADRALMTSRPSIEGDDRSDYLLENRNGRYVDVSEKAGIPKGTNSMGVTAGDLNNDGYVDLIVIMFDDPDIILLNQGDGTFKQVDGLIPKASTTVGNHAVAVDFNLDGRVDVIVGHGDVSKTTGTYLVMRSVLPLTENSHYLLVTVANEPSRGATALHAVVTAFVGGQRLTRRVGSRGAQDGGASYITTVHFGTGVYSRVECVRVRWSNGVQRKVMDVAANQKLFFGVN